MIHADIPLVRGYLLESTLYDEDPTKTQWVPCKVYAISSYPGSSPTFKVALGEGSLFDYIPLHRVVTSTTPTTMTLQECTFGVRCPIDNPDIVVNVHDFLRGKEVTTWVQGRSICGQYVCTVDWYKDNLSGHLVTLENGAIVLCPNHKLTVGRSDQPLPKYKKMRTQW